MAKSKSDKSDYTLHTVEVECNVGGRTFDVTEINMSLSPDTVPSVTVSIGGTKDSKTNTKPEDIIKFVSKLGAQVYKNVANLKVTVKPLGGKGNKQVIVLKSWYLTGVGLSDLGARGSISLQITMMHPAAKLDLSGIISYGNVIPEGKSKALEGSLAASTSIYGSYKSALKGWAQELESGVRESKDPDKTKQQIQDTKKIVDDMDKYLKPEGDSLGSALASQLKGNAVSVALVRALRSSSAIGSIWQFMLSNILPGSGLMIYPTFDKDTLKVAPASVWDTKGEMALDMSSIPRISLSPIDPSPVKGVVCLTSRTKYGQHSYWTRGDNTDKTQISVSDMTYLIDGAEGKVESLSFLPWWITAGLDNHVQGSNTVSFTRDPTTSTDAYEASAHAQKEFTQRIATVMGVLTKGHLYSRVKQYTQATVMTTLMLADEKGKPLYGCHRAKIGDTGVSFFINKVNHVISVQGKSAYTTISGNYVKPGSIPGAEEIAQGPHPYYR